LLPIEEAFEPAREAVAGGRIPGAVLGLVLPGGERAVRWAGSAQVEPTPVPIGRETWFDLASLTKVVFTTTAILDLADRGVISLDDRLVTAIPDLRQYHADAAERQLTFRQCLAHQTHLPGVEPLYTYGQDPATLRAFILQRVWPSGPPVYSDVNFMLLGIAIERLSGRPLLSHPLAQGFSFKPDPELCAATERCSWRGRVLRGEVHDENAFALGGASGHAGLFGTVDAVLDFAQSLLDGTGMSEAGLRSIRTRASRTRTVGWEIKHALWSGGEACSDQTVGHTGFTGTGLWIDFERGIAWTLLTNRVHPSRHVDTGIAALRQRTGDLVTGTFDRSS
jgi:CubicO group peptidase (beta-lactamase class C family)